jgi:hypothetical protein
VERWREVPGYAGLYQVSDLGNVASVPRVVARRNGTRHTVRGRWLRPWPGGQGPYVSVALWRGRERRVFRVARLVLLAFVGPPPEPGMQASHEPNPDPLDNRLCNLRWRTHHENMVERDSRRRFSMLDIAICTDDSGPGIDPDTREGEDSLVPF